MLTWGMLVDARYNTPIREIRKARLIYSRKRAFKECTEMRCMQYNFGFPNTIPSILVHHFLSFEHFPLKLFSSCIVFAFAKVFAKKKASLIARHPLTCLHIARCLMMAQWVETLQKWKFENLYRRASEKLIKLVALAYLSWYINYSRLYP